MPQKWIIPERPEEHNKHNKQEIIGRNNSQHTLWSTVRVCVSLVYCRMKGLKKKKVDVNGRTDSLTLAHTHVFTMFRRPFNENGPFSCGRYARVPTIRFKA